MIHRSSLPHRLKNFTPVGSKVLVRRLKREEVTIGGVVVPLSAYHIEMARFDVLAVGPKVEHVKVGDQALAPCQLQFGKIEVDGDLLEVANEELLAAVIPA